MDATQIAERIVRSFLMPALALGTDRGKWHERSRDTGRAAAAVVFWVDGLLEGEGWSEGTDPAPVLIEVLGDLINRISALFENEARAIGADPAGPAYQMVLEWFCRRVKKMAEVVR